LGPLFGKEKGKKNQEKKRIWQRALRAKNKERKKINSMEYHRTSS
jgi:GrpB-like predicted nucleotidyltransferase (UPF0157 family)